MYTSLSSCSIYYTLTRTSTKDISNNADIHCASDLQQDAVLGDHALSYFRCVATSERHHQSPRSSKLDNAAGAGAGAAAAGFLPAAAAVVGASAGALAGAAGFLLMAPARDGSGASAGVAASVGVAEAAAAAGFLAAAGAGVGTCSNAQSMLREHKIESALVIMHNQG